MIPLYIYKTTWHEGDHHFFEGVDNPDCLFIYRWLRAVNFWNTHIMLEFTNAPSLP